jgi:hypothetical protein
MQYYLSATGSDSNNGTSEATPWQTLAKITPTLLQPGDMLWLKGGHTFTGTLLIQSVGTVSQPIFISSDGRAVISCGTGDGVRLENPEYIFVNNLHVIGSDAERTSNSTAPTATGAGITAVSTRTSGAQLRGVRISNNKVSGTRTGILMQATNGTNNQTSFQGFTDWQITYNEIWHTSLCGIFTWAQPGTPTKPALDFGGIYPEVGYARNVFTDFVIERNNVHDNYGYNTNDWSLVGWGTGIRTMNASGTSAKPSLVQYNRIDNGGHAGAMTGMPANFEAEVCNWITWQYNESSNCRMDGLYDGAGFDVFDGGVENCICQYNYAYNNDGYGIGGGGAGGLDTKNNIARFNILVNNNLKDKVADIQIWGPMSNTYFYNNVVYTNVNGTAALISFPAQVTGFYFINNIFISLGSRKIYEGQSNSPAFLNNIYWRGTPGNIGLKIGGFVANTLAEMHAAGVESWNGVNYGINADPLLANAGAMPTFLPAQEVKKMTDYIPMPGSPALGGGVDFSSILGDIGPHDFHGNPLPVSSFNVGSHQGIPVQGSPLPGTASQHHQGILIAVLKMI